MLQEEMVAERLRKDWAFTPVPSVVLRDKTIPDPEKITYQYLVDHAGTKSHCWVSQEKLAQDRGKGLRTISRHITSLKSKGLVQVRQGSSNTTLVSISFLYNDPKIRYKESERNPHSVPVQTCPEDKNGVKKVSEQYAKNGVGTYAKNGAQIKKREVENRILTYPGDLPSGKSPNTEKSPDVHVINFQSKLREYGFHSPEVQEMSLRPTRRRQSDPKGMPPKSKVDKAPKEERFSVDAESGNPVGKKKKPKRENKTKKKVHSLWSKWKTMIQSLFQVSLPGPYPRGADYGHLKNLVLYAEGDQEYAWEILRYLAERWEEVKSSHHRAERMNIPTLYLADALKGDIHVNLQTGSSFKPMKNKKQEDNSGRGVNRHPDNWDDLETSWKERHSS